MSKRLLTVFCVVVLLLGLFAPAGSVRAFDEDYGKEAWECLQYIDANLGYRLADGRKYSDSKNHDAAGAWIRSKLESYGYEVHVVSWFNEDTPITSYYVRKPGRSHNRIVVGAHYDSVDTKGVEDNGTGVSVVLELAKRFVDFETPLTVDFCFWDGEETVGFSGSYSYIGQVGDLESVVCNINIDCVGAGDIMFAYGGEYENDELVRAWPLYMAMDGAYKCGGIPLNYIPQEVNEWWRYPTRNNSSDHYYFNKNGIPYVYFEANRWVTPDGEVAVPEKPQLYNSADPGFSATGGQIIHTPEHEDLATLERIVPGRLQKHMKDYSKLATWMIRYMDTTSPGLYQHPIEHEPEEPSTQAPTTEEPTTEEPTTEEPTTEEVTETPEETSSEIPETTPPTEPGTTGAPEVTEPPVTTADPQNGQTPEHRGIGPAAYIAVAGGISLLLIVLSILMRRK